MYTAGFIKTTQPNILINPAFFESIPELFSWLTNFLNTDNFLLDIPITLELLTNALEEHPVQINMNGYQVAIILGHSEILMKTIEKVYTTDQFDIYNL